jgi:biopolymer transport protein TolR
MAFGSARSGALRSEINITPLVDVVLVLLIIFMVMTPSLLKEVDVKVPERTEVDTTAAPSSSEEVIVTVTSAGLLQLNHEPIEELRLAARIRDAMAERVDKRVFFEIDDDANYGDAIHVMDICRGAGVKTLGLMTR